MVEESDRGTRSPSCLLPYRPMVREMMQSPPRALLIYVAATATNPTVQRAAIWLRGRCRGSLGTATLARLWMSADVGLRKEVTRAFKRMEAWDYLRVIETSDPNPRIRRLANQPTPRAFPVRLARFLARIKRREAGPSGTAVSQRQLRSDRRPTRQTAVAHPADSGAHPLARPRASRSRGTGALPLAARWSPSFSFFVAG